MQTDNFNLDLIETLGDVTRVYNPNLIMVDRVLRVLGSPNDGSSVTVDDPTTQLDSGFTLSGDLPAETQFFYGYTFTDPATGLESALSTAFDPLEVNTPDEILAPIAPTLLGAGSGGNLAPGVYNYAVSYYVGTSDIETSAVNQADVELLIANGYDQQVTITLAEAIPGGVTGFNIYRRKPGNSSFYFVTSVSSGSSYVDDGSAAEDCERFAPVTSNAMSTYAVELTLDALPTGYYWNVYRSTDVDVWDNTYIGSVTDAGLVFTDTGFDPGVGTPPSETLILTPGNVGLRSGSGDPTSGDGNDGDWWINTTSYVMFGPKFEGEWPVVGILLGASDVIDGGEW